MHMPSATSRVYNMGEITPQQLGEAIVGFLRTNKNMIAEGTPTPEGFFLQAKSDSDNWKKIAGMDKAIQVQIIAGGNEMATVSIGQGKWSDKVGAGVVGAFLFAPLAVTAIVGAVGQNKLPDEILGFCDQYVMSGGRNIVASAAPASAGQRKCPSCGHPNPQSTRFCANCGAAMSESCSVCGAELSPGAKFCNACGAPRDGAEVVCAACGTANPAGSRFCNGCGAALS
ncbi:MAG: hypothetical protein BZ138_06455 [Methanosphaera sp. rholeuAM270]|nr:MAG: hypothetical protein BZ138_06455 [Methanosphaera sp. rholeuAM270]